MSFAINLDEEDEEYSPQTSPPVDPYSVQQAGQPKRPRDGSQGEPQPKRNNKAAKGKNPLTGNAEAGKTRSIYIGGMPEGVEHWDVHKQIFDQIKGAPVEALRLVPSKQCAFIDFMDPAGALSFAEKWEKGGRRFVVKEKEVKIAWARSTRFPSNVQTAIENGATRNVYLSNINLETDEEVEAKKEELHSLFKQFGPIDMIRVVPERSIAFVHLASISSAMQAVDVLSSRPEWKGHRINFGSDRCGDRPPPGVHPSIQASKRKLDDLSSSSLVEEDYYHPADSERIPHRTIYIGGLTKEITLEDLCDVIRGGLIQSVRMASPDKHCAFVTFVDEQSAVAFFDFFSTHGMTVKGATLKLGWSKPAPVPSSVTHALQKGATRTIYIGCIVLEALGSDPEGYLTKECSTRFGPVETVNLVPAKGIAFVSFCNLLDAVKALAGLRELTEFAQCKLAYGKDRCAQPIRPPMMPMPMYPAQPYPYPPSPYYPYPPSNMYPSPPPHPYPSYPPPSYPPYYQPYPHYVPMIPVPYLLPIVHSTSSTPMVQLEQLPTTEPLEDKETQHIVAESSPMH